MANSGRSTVICSICEPEYSHSKPVYMNCVPSVTMKEGMPVRTKSTPLIRPITPVTASASNKPVQGLPPATT